MCYCFVSCPVACSFHIESGPLLLTALFLLALPSLLPSRSPAVAVVQEAFSPSAAHCTSFWAENGAAVASYQFDIKK